MNNNLFDVVLLLALPASGKSEVRKFMAALNPQELSDDFHIGENLQLDDFPYVNIMKRIDAGLVQLGKEKIFYTEEGIFADGRDWSTLIQLLNEDYHDMINQNRVQVESYAKLLFERIDRAAAIDHIEPRLGKLDEKTRENLAILLEDECHQIQQDKENGYPEDMNNKTIIIEAARGGKQGSSMPLADPYGYQYSLRFFAPEILERATILYIWVTPEESRRKNTERADPNNPGSILNHGVPMSVMLNDYGVDDMDYLRTISEIENTITVKSYGRTYHLPIGIFDNRHDQTTFLRQDSNKWDSNLLSQLRNSIKKATDTMFLNYKK